MLKNTTCVYGSFLLNYSDHTTEEKSQSLRALYLIIAASSSTQ